MKKIAFILFLSFICIYQANSQEDKKEFTPSGKAFGKVFWNYHYDMTKDVNQASAFELNRSYFGYKYALSENMSAKITFDVGSNSGGSAFTAFLKIAQLDWKVASPVKLSMGLIGLKQFNDQEKFWGYRYLYKSFQDQNGFGTSADLGINAEIKLHEKVKMNVLVVNGEGYKKTQDSFGMYRIGANVVAKPIDDLTLKVYYSTMPTKALDVNGEDSTTATIGNLAVFAGYKIKDKFRIGAEYNMMNNGKKYASEAEDHDLSGISVYTTYIVNKKIEFFGRFDQLTSNKLSGATDPWNNAKDGSAILAGLQYAPVKGVKVALNFQSWNYKESGIDNRSFIYLNFEYKF